MIILTFTSTAYTQRPLMVLKSYQDNREYFENYAECSNTLPRKSRNQMLSFMKGTEGRLLPN